MLTAQPPFAETTRCNPFFDFCQQSNQGAQAPALNHNKKEPNEGQLGMKPVEDLLASEMNKLSVQERSKALDDVHCVGDELHETPEIIENSLREFEDALQQEKNPIYEMAVNQNRAYVEDPEFRLKFLRAFLHDVEKSVRNMLQFLGFKATFFGNEKVARDITLDDLNEEDKEVLFSGLYHIQEGTDRMGRVILHFFNVHMGKGEIGSHVRATYYIMFNILASMPAAQKKGVVYCFYDLSKPGESFPNPGFSFFRTIVQFLDCIPVRSSVHHSCLRTRDRANYSLSKAMIGMVVQLFPKHMRVRARIHYGTDMELQYELQDHGIPLDTFPVDAFGNVRKEIQMAWFHKYQAREALRNAVDIGEAGPNKFPGTDSAHRTTPGSASPTKPPRHDILLGRGRPIQKHPGNICFREYLKQYSDEYDKAPRTLRRDVLEKIRKDLITNRGIRFLQQRNGAWVECSKADAEKTISQAFRNMRKKTKREEHPV